MKKLNFMGSIGAIILSSCAFAGPYNSGIEPNLDANFPKNSKEFSKDLEETYSKNTFYLKGGGEGSRHGGNPSVGLGFRHLGTFGIDAGFSATPKTVSLNLIPILKFYDAKTYGVYVGLGPGFSIDTRRGGFLGFDAYLNANSILGLQFKTRGFFPKFIQLETSREFTNKVYQPNYSIGVSTGIGF